MTKTNLPWVEKYRPKTFDDLVSHEDIIKTISKFIREDNVPHLLFYGPPGTGKTSTILACARQLYTPAQFSSMVLELNASDERGIGIVRGEILTFASTRTIFRSGFKLIILDEADEMTVDAQNALRRVIEKYTENVRFCIITNYLNKIIAALQSRCTRFRFGPLTQEQIMPRLNYVIDEEHLKVTEDGKKALLTLAGGDMRKVLNVLQSTWLAYGEVTEDTVYTCVGHPLKIDIENIVKWLLNDDFEVTYENFLTPAPDIKELKTAKGLALGDILTEVHKYVLRIEFPYEVLCSLLDKMSNIESYLSIGISENILLTGLISAFQYVKDLEPAADS